MAGGSAQPSTLGAAAKALTFPRTRAAVWALAVRRQPVESRTLRVILWWGASFFVLAVYGLLREFMDDFGMPRHGGGWEEAVFGGLPSVWLQDHLWTLAPKPLEWASVVVHSSWFFVPPIAGLFVSFRRPDRIGSFFRWWMALELLALPLWAIFPVRPPWMDNGEVTRIIAIRFGGHIDDPNPFAALPSLHVAFPLMISLWFFRERWLRPALLMLAYTSLISFEVVFSGEHYVMDVAGAAVVAGVVAVAASPQAAFNSISRLASGLRDAVRARWPKPR